VEPKCVRELRLKLEAKGVSMEEFAEKWIRWNQQKAEGFEGPAIHIFAGWRLAYPKTWERILKRNLSLRKG
jgi:hypothetical protein